MAITPIEPNDLPGTWQGYIQQETTDAKASMSEYIVQQIGSDLNYLKQQQDFIESSIDTFASMGIKTQVLTGTGIYFAGPVQVISTTPNSKNYLGGRFFLYTADGAYTVIVAPNFYNSRSISDGTDYDLFFALLGNQFYARGYSNVGGISISGVLFYEP